ncbi:MAG: hypothetical protein JEZ11_20100 [Desulfobacterales bacterium]|nr:hypothetical protein [Desulfobacterales bacterium]
MTYQTIAWIEFAIDAFGLVFCLTVLAYGLRYRKTPLVLRPAERVRVPGTDAFNAEMRLQTVQQQAEAALAALNTAMAGVPSQGGLGRSPSLDAVDDRQPAQNRAPLGRLSPEPTLPESVLPGRMSDSESPYETVRELADQGLDVDAIYQRLRIPKGEIRLALHLREVDGSRLRVLG